MSDFPVSIRVRFKRSIDLARDFYDAPHLNGYIITPTARQVLRQLRDALQKDSAERAWTITGPYGSGKSAFALFASHLLRGTENAHTHLQTTDPKLADDFSDVRDSPFCPVLVGGSRQSLRMSLLGGLATSLERFTEASMLDVDMTPLVGMVEKARTLGRSEDPGDEAIANLFTEAAEHVRDLTGGGLFVVVDELGKMLEYAAVHPNDGDIFLLQLLAEHAARTTETDQAPLFLATILHQAFDRYASNLDRVQREEWQKVQGRFEDIAYVEPTDATAQLLGKAIEIKDESLVRNLAGAVDKVVQEADLSQRIDPEETRQLLHEALPLHPAVALIVGPLFRRLAQNERSLFAFLAAGEPGGFIDVLRRNYQGGDTLPFYRLDHLYDYLLTTIGGTLFSQSTSELWAETESAIGRLKEPSPLSVRLLKQIVLLNYAGEIAGLKATTDLLLATACADRKDVEEELKSLIDERVVVYRKYDDSYRIWQGSDIDFEEELENARSSVSSNVRLAEMLRETLPPSPVAAHRHSYHTGTTRVFDVTYASGDAWKEELDQLNEAADGHIVYVLPERGDRRGDLIEELEAAIDDSMLFIAVPEGVGALRNAVYELSCLDWIRDNVDTLEGDAAARRELAERRADLENRTESRLNRLLVADESGKNPCLWIHQDADGTLRSSNIDDRRELQSMLSDACDATFTKTPEIWNELLNLRHPSPSAVRGQKKLLEAMVLGNEEEGRDPRKERLGIDGTPAEYGLYASIVKATGMHREADDGTWHFHPPDGDEKPGCHAVWMEIRGIFDEADGKPVALDNFFESLTSPPHGVREGLIPVFLFAFFKANEDETALYENGTLLKEIQYGTIERLLKTPSKFAMQQVTIEGVREDVLQQLAPLVGLSEDERKPLPFVLRLLQRVHGLPPYVRQTSSMSPEALAVRQVLYKATDPTTLLFEDLPSRLSIGVDSFLGPDRVDDEKVHVFVRELQKRLREITRAYDKLVQEIQRWTAAAFDVSGETVNEQRQEIAERAQALEPHASDSDLKAFIIRATNEMMDTQAWYESIAALLASSPPVKWVDDDVDTFKSELRRVSKKFRNLEPLIFETDDDGESSPTGAQERKMSLHRIRLGVTRLGEPEQETVVQFHPEDDTLVEQTAKEIRDRLESDNEFKDKSAQIKLAALGRLIQQLSSEREEALETQLDTDVNE